MKKLLQIALLAGVLGAFFLTERKVTQAADYPVDPYPKAIGRNMDIYGIRTPGIAYSVDGVLKEFSYDAYNRDNGDWKYSFTQINEDQRGSDITNIGDTSAMIQVNNRSQSKHYQVHAARLRESLGDFSVVTHCYSGGKDIYYYKEYSFMSYPSTRLKSIMTHNELAVGGFSSEEESLIYHFYRPRELNSQTEVAVQAGEGKLEHGGVAYYTEDGYYLRELPAASLVRPGYSVDFLGWYDSEEGGSQIQAGTWCPSGTTLYARWNVTPLSYDVICYDICGTTPSGKVLGEHTWKGEYGTSVSGKDLGESRDSGSYYQGYSYENDTTAVVSTSGAKIYRYFSEDTYQISFDGNGATGESMEVIENCAFSRQITLPINCFQREHCITLEGNGKNVTCETSHIYVSPKFLGWALTPDGQVKYPDGAVVSGLAGKEENITLYAVWSDEKFQVREKPKRLGYEFAGWASAPDAESGRTQFTVSEDMTLYAVWKPGSVSYHVEYYKENLDGHYDMVSSYAFEGYTEEKVEITPDENIFLGYFLDRHSSVLSGNIRPNGGLVLTAFYTRNVNEVVYNMNGGEKSELPEPVKKKYGEELTIWEKSDFKKPGYTFAGWSQDTEEKHQVFAPGERVIMPNHSMTLYAAWNPISYEIELDGNGADNHGSIQKIKAAYDEKIYLPACQEEKTGYEFVGWNSLKDGSGVSYSCEEAVQKLCGKEGDSIRLFAQWQPISFVISYDSNAARELQDAVKGTVADTSYSFTEASYTARDIFYLKGYQFMGWNTRADGSGTMFFPGENIAGKITSKKDCVLYAIWKLGENIGFQIEVTEEGAEEPMDTLQYYGKTGERVSEALRRACRDILQGEAVVYFYPGYEVVNREELEKNIQGDYSTVCYVTVKKRSCSLNYGVYHQGSITPIMVDEGYIYQEKAALRESLEYLGEERRVSRYVDTNGTVYLPGESISLERSTTVIPQFQISIYGEDGKKEREDYCCWRNSYPLPGTEKVGYEFTGWYSKEGVLLGKEKDLISGIEDIQLFPRWSKPLSYRINYDVEEQLLRILENKISRYQYMTEVKLPDKNQVVSLLEDYEFVGWYLAEDEQQHIIDRIAPGMYGDVTLKAKLVKKGLIGDGEDTTEEDKKPVQPGGSEEDNKKPQEQPGSTGADDNNSDLPSSMNTNQKILSSEEKPNSSAAKKKVGQAAKVGTVFWKGKLKYQIISCKKGKMSVKAVGNRYRKKQLQIPSKISYQTKTYQVTAIGGKAFKGNRYIRKIAVPSSVHTIGKQAFAHMKKLNRITFGRHLKKLGKQACYGDTSLKSVTIKSLSKIKVGKKAFAGCKKLHRVTGIKKSTD